MLYLPDRPASENPGAADAAPGFWFYGGWAGRTALPVPDAAALKSGGFTVICERNQIYPNNLKINK